MPKRRSSDNGKNLQKSGKVGKVYDDGEENVIQQSNKKEKENIRMFSQTSSTNDSSTSKSFPESSKAKREKTCDETVTVDPPTRVTPRVSRQVSHGDPPTPAEIKITRIKSIVERTNGFEPKIIDFADHTQSKNYLYISETLMKALLDLDTVDSEGLDTVRKSRKEAVDAVQALVDKLEEKLEENKLKSGEQSS
ncbi:uncharacterized protein LOC124441100 [Xenia sp. Carnegie-2017]|uniref:uncharacterized protein LOC124441100 n=1 Tax=Xenia sp. Carnegie-2017 TaxID=2897299 RepID=UPI001F035706|nr:uncharacterized protein LOC124441100 [Xenia sp. Carnegie-2017]